ncbi:uncharacterized protein LOC133825835 [Humulus lupulus]|uniref:uncharacterized protein LOC133825835 n=1 Tax=Humulus lupulus TaxID=3486 RepID=UPI002B40F3EB|nr:uncharacterized protein LOC133825835 [Humulus lupulus]
MMHLQEAIQQQPFCELLIEDEREARQEYKVVYKAYLSFLLQNAKLNWVKEGDTNTAIFHASLRARRARNRIYSITDMEGKWVEKQDQVSHDFLNFYKDLLGSKMAKRKSVFTSLVSHGTILNEQQQRLMVQNYTKEEVKEAIFMCEAVLSFLHLGKLLKELNSSTLTLIPKSKCPESVSDFRPIACCNVLYKVATKMICARMRSVLPVLVAQNQSGFVQGRFIAYNIMVCQDLVRHYGRKNAKVNCMIKLGLRKAYDTIE